MGVFSIEQNRTGHHERGVLYSFRYAPIICVSYPVPVPTGSKQGYPFLSVGVTLLLLQQAPTKDKEKAAADTDTGIIHRSVEPYMADNY